MQRHARRAADLHSSTQRIQSATNPLRKPHCVADETYFDTPDRIQDDATRYAPADRAAPEGWGRGEADLWVGLEPPVPNPPAQGWKIHVSVTPADAPRCIELVWDYCVAHR